MEPTKGMKRRGRGLRQSSQHIFSKQEEGGGKWKGKPFKNTSFTERKGVVRGQVHRGAREWLKDVITAPWV